jgi:hypothetical protein
MPLMLMIAMRTNEDQKASDKPKKQANTHYHKRIPNIEYRIPNTEYQIPNIEYRKNLSERGEGRGT